MPCILPMLVVPSLALHYLPLALVDLCLHLGIATGMYWALMTLCCLVLPSSCHGLVQSALSLYLTLDTGGVPCLGYPDHQISLLMPTRLEGRPRGRGKRERFLGTNCCQSAGKCVLPPPQQEIEVTSGSKLHSSSATFVTVGRKSCFTGIRQMNIMVLFQLSQSCTYSIASEVNHRLPFEHFCTCSCRAATNSCRFWRFGRHLQQGNPLTVFGSWVGCRGGNMEHG